MKNFEEKFVNDKMVEIIKDVKFYLGQGLSKEKAIQMVREQTCIGKKHFQMTIKKL